MATAPLDPTAPAEVLPCPSCRRLTPAPVVTTGIEVVRCRGCDRLLRRRPALTAEQRAQAEILRTAAAALEQRCTTLHRRKSRRDRQEMVDDGLLKGAELLREWSRTIHKRPRGR